MNIVLRILILLCFIQELEVFGQKRFDPSPEEISQAKTLKEKYSDEDDRIAILNSDLVYEFSYNNSSDKVEVNFQKSEKYMNISKMSRILVAEFYTENSEIPLFEIRSKTDKKITSYVYDGYHEDDDLFYHDARRKSTELNFPVQGYVNTLNLVKKTKDIKYFTSVYFTDRYPIEHKTVVFKIPNWLNVELKELNFKDNSIEKTVSQENGFTVYKYVINELNAIKGEVRMPGPSHREPHILVLPKSHTKNKSETTLFKETGDLYSWYKSLVDKMEEDPTKLNDIVEQLTQDATTEEEKIKNIYYWVQDNIKYIAFEDGIAGFKPDESQNVFEKKYGDCKGMANLLRQMLNIAGFDAHLTWIGTKRIAYDYSTPNLSVDNHMICTLNHNGKRYFLDGTQKFNALGEYAERIQGRQVLIENGDDYILDHVPDNKSSANVEYFNLNYKVEGDALVGNAQKRFNGESKSQFLYTYSTLKTDKKEEALKKYLNENNKNIEISNVETSELTNRDIETILNYDLKINNRVVDYDGQYYIDLDYFKEYGSFKFKEERHNDYLFRHKTNYISNISLEIPEGYMVSYKPENISYSSDNIDIKVTYSIKESKLIYTKVFNLKTAILPVDEFEEWEKFNEQLVKTYNDQITLTKQ